MLSKSESSGKGLGNGIDRIFIAIAGLSFAIAFENIFKCPNIYIDLKISKYNIYNCKKIDE